MGIGLSSLLSSPIMAIVHHYLTSFPSSHKRDSYSRDMRKAFVLLLLWRTAEMQQSSCSVINISPGKSTLQKTVFVAANEPSSVALEFC